MAHRIIEISNLSDEELVEKVLQYLERAQDSDSKACALAGVNYQKYLSAKRRLLYKKRQKEYEEYIKNIEEESKYNDMRIVSAFIKDDEDELELG